MVELDLERMVSSLMEEKMVSLAMFCLYELVLLLCLEEYD